MSCIVRPLVEIKAQGHREYMNVDCGHCLNCMIKKQSQLAFLANKEQLIQYQKGNGCSFVTLTYSDNYLPINKYGFVTLQRSDVQKFIKNMRRQMEYYGVTKKFKYIYCGELGDGSHSNSLTGVSTCRPHYHIVFLGLSDVEVKFYTRKLWKYGICDVGPLGAGGIRYVTKYMTKASPAKDVKEFREVFEVQNPFIYHSVGLGKEWILKNMDKIVKDEFTFNLNGKRYLFPKYVMAFVAAHTSANYILAVRNFMRKEVFLKLPKGIDFEYYDFEQSYLKYKRNVFSLRSQGKPVEVYDKHKCYYKPFSVKDRTYTEQLVLDALSG